MCMATPAMAAPFAVQLGEVRLGLDAPPGFSDTLFTGSPRLAELAESLTSASNRILLFAVSDADLRQFMTGEPPELRRYMIAVTPRGMEHGRVGAEQFTLYVSDSLRELGPPPAPAADYRRFLDEQPPRKASLLAELRRSAELVSILQGARLPGTGGWGAKPKYLLSTTTLMWLRGKALSVSVYTGYDGSADLEWIHFITGRWIQELQRLNSR